jgi:hypothetical protein
MDIPTPHTACHHSGTAPTVPQIISIHFRILCYDRRPKTSFLTLIEGVTDARPACLLAGDFSTLRDIFTALRRRRGDEARRSARQPTHMGRAISRGGAIP